MSEPGVPAEAERAVDQDLVAADRDIGADLEIGPAQLVLDLFVTLLDGLITNGKFCCMRRLWLSLTWWRRPLRSRASVLQTDVALSGEPDDPGRQQQRLLPGQRDDLVRLGQRRHRATGPHQAAHRPPQGTPGVPPPPFRSCRGGSASRDGRKRAPHASRRPRSRSRETAWLREGVPSLR